MRQRLGQQLVSGNLLLSLFGNIHKIRNAPEVGVEPWVRFLCLSRKTGETKIPEIDKAKKVPQRQRTGF